MQFHVRTNGGNTFMVDGFKEALAQLGSTDGYRLDIFDEEDGNEMTIRRVQNVEGDQPASTAFTAEVTLHLK